MNQPRHTMSWITGPISSRQPAQAEPAAEGFLSLVDEFLDSWARWREACEDIRSAHERWGNCETPQRGLAFASYRAALDREEHAARVYSVWTDRVHAAKG
jgi:hypothetical protein